ncbi:ATP-binding protein, partial [Pyxidicoccus sp. 3LFB2]
MSHRHLKPSNVVLPSEGAFEDATLIDFGLALEDLGEPSLAALPLSAVQYLAPEQLGLVRAGPGPGSDLYAVGLMLFESLAGALPFPGATLGELLRQHLGTVPELRGRGLAVPRAVEQWVQHLLSEAPGERYPSAEAALADLEDITSELARGLTEPSVVVGRRDKRPHLTEPAFIGRATEIEALERTLTAAARGQGGLVRVEGASGGGKTMLLDELERRARAHGARVFRGQALDRSAPAPLQTLMGIMRDIAALVENTPSLKQSLREAVEARLGTACTVCPRLAEALEMQPTTCERGPEDLGEERTLRELAAVFDALGDSESPALILLDDCQWSDELTLKLLARLGALPGEAPEPRRFVTVAAFRTEAIPGDHLLRRMDSLLHVRLAPFTEAELRDVAESMAGGLPEEALETVGRLSEGNPFMAVAMVRGLVESGALEPGPSGWRVVPARFSEVRSSRRAASVLLRRLRLLPEDTRAVLTAGAILGREFEVDMAAVLVERSPEQAVAMLEEARQRHLLWAAPSTGRYTFAHDRIREALLERLPEQAQHALHLAAALELERRAPERSFELAWHFEAAGALERAWPHALKAAEAARALHTLDVASRYYQLADRGAVGADDATRLRILEGLGDVLRIRGSGREAEAVYFRAQGFARTRLDRARLEGRRGESRFGRFAGLDSLDWTESALRLIGQRVPGGALSRGVFLLWAVLVHLSRVSVLLRWARRSPPLEGEALLAAYLLQGLAQGYWVLARPLTASWWAHLHALNLAERHAPSQELATSYSSQGVGISLLSQNAPRVPLFLPTLLLARARRYLQRALALREAFGDAFHHGATLHLYQFMLIHCARYAESLEVGRKALRLSQQAGASHDWHAVNAREQVGTALYQLGELPEAVAHAQAQYRLGVQRDEALRRSYGLSLWAAASAGLLPEATLAAELGRSSSDAAYNTALHRAEVLHAEGHRLLREAAPARAVAVLRQAEQCMTDARLRLPLFLAEIRALLVRALREQAAQVPSWAFSIRAGLLREARAIARRECLRPLPFRNNLASIYRELGWMAAMEGRNRRARRYFGQSLAIAERLDMRYERARTLLARAEVGT